MKLMGVPSAKKKRIVARPRKRKGPQSIAKEEGDSFNIMEDSKFDEELPEPF